MATTSKKSSKISSNQKQVNSVLKAVASTKGKSSADQVSAITKAAQRYGGSGATGTARVSQDQWEAARQPGSASLSSVNKQLSKLGSVPQYDPKAPVDANTVADMQNQVTPPFVSAPMDGIEQANGFVASTAVPTQMQTAYDAEVAQREFELQKGQKDLDKFAKSFDLGEKYQDLQQEAGIPDITKQLQQANLQLSQMQSQYAMTNQELAQQEVPQPFVIGQQNELAKTASLQLGAQASYVQALQGNYDLANHYVDKMIEMEQADFQQQYEAKKYNLNIAMEFLSRADAKQAKMIDFELDKQKADYSQMLSTKEATMKNALLNGASQSVIQAISRSKTTDDIYSAAGRFAVDPMAQAQLTTERLQQDRLRQEMSGGSGSGAPDVKNINGKDMQWNPSTGKWEPIEGDDSNSAVKYEEATTNLERTNRILNDPTSIGLITGQVQGKTAAVLGALNPFQKNFGQFKKVAGLVTGKTLNDKDDVLADLSYMINNQTFNKLTELKSGGATFGSLSDPERVAIGKAATYLAASTRTDEQGNILGIKGSKEKFRENLLLVQKGFEAAQEDANIKEGLNQDDILQIKDL